MPYLANFGPDYLFDIFVSYAHGPVITDWSREFAEQNLVDHVNFNLGEKEKTRQVALWMDRSLRGNWRLTPQLQKNVTKSALLLVIMSDFYLESNWCTKEAAWFEEALGGWSKTDGRIFVVQTKPTDIGLWPKFLRDITGYEFYEHPTGSEPRTLGWPRPSVNQDTAYWPKVITLAEQVAGQLKSIAQQLQNPPVVHPKPTLIKPGPGASERPTVFLAVATEEADDARAAVRDLLETSFDVLPAEGAPDLGSIPNLLNRLLPTCDAFVQIIGVFRGKWNVDEVGFVQYQHAEAVRQGKPVLVWRCSDVDIPTRDGTFRAFVDGLQLSAAANARAFAEEVRSTLSPRGPGRRRIFVQAAHEDRELRQELREKLRDRGFVVFPLRDQPVPAMRDLAGMAKGLTDRMLRCDAIVYLNGSGPAEWLDLEIYALDDIPELWDIGSGKLKKRVAVVDKPTEPPLPQFDPKIPVFRFNSRDFLDAFACWINTGEAA